MSKFISILLYATLIISSCSNRIIVPKVNYYSTEISTPIPFGEGVISTKENSEFDLTFSTDGRKVYFSRRKPNEK